MSVVLQPLGNRVLVRLRPIQQKGLVVRVNNNESVREADVIATGPQCRDVKPGMGVVVSALAGQAVGDEILMPESSVLGYLED